MTNLIKFQNNELEVIDINGTPYLRGNQIGSALNLSFPQKAVQKIYRKHRKEFTDDMMLSVEVMTNGGKQLTNVFSVRGAMLIAMLSKSDKAAAFRQDVLDVLEGKQSTKAQAEQMNAIRAEILRLKPEWVKIIHYSACGLTAREIGKIMGRCKDTIYRERLRIKACGFSIQIPAKGGQRKQLSLPFGG